MTVLPVTVAVTAAVLAALALGVYLSWRATRLHRLHVRVDIARAALEEALRRRCAAVLDLVAARVRAVDDRGGGDPGGVDHGGVPGPVEELMAAATAALAAPRGTGRGRDELAESRLSRALRAAVEPTGDQAGPAVAAPSEELRERLAAVAAAVRSVQLARTFYNDAVSDTRRARRSRPVRLFRLAGTAPLPDYFDMDDQAPRTPYTMAEPDTL